MGNKQSNSSASALSTEAGLNIGTVTDLMPLWPANKKQLDRNLFRKYITDISPKLPHMDGFDAADPGKLADQLFDVIFFF